MFLDRKEISCFQRFFLENTKHNIIKQNIINIMASLNLFEMGSKHSAMADKERTKEMIDLMKADFQDMMNHFRTVPSCTGKTDAFRLLGLSSKGGYRNGFVERKLEAGKTLEQATTQFDTWFNRCKEHMICRTPRMQIPKEPQRAPVAEPVAELTKKQRVV